MDSARTGSARRAAHKCGVPSESLDGGKRGHEAPRIKLGIKRETKGQWDRARASEQCGLRRFWRVLVRFTKRVVKHGSLKVCAGPEDPNAGLNEIDEIAGRSTMVNHM